MRRYVAHMGTLSLFLVYLGWCGMWQVWQCRFSVRWASGWGEACNDDLIRLTSLLHCYTTSLCRITMPYSEELPQPPGLSAGRKVVPQRRNGKPVDTSRKPAKAYAQASNVSPPTKASNTTQRRPAEHADTSHNQRRHGLSAGGKVE